MSIKPFKPVNKTSKSSSKVSDKVNHKSSMVSSKNILFQYSVSNWRDIPVDEVNKLNKMYKDYHMRSRK